MGKIVFGIIAAIASFMLVDSLTCNVCSYGFAGYCLSNSEVSCSTNTSQCSTSKLSFIKYPSIGINSQGCTESSQCNKNSTGSVAGFTYEYKIECCNTDKCNPVTLSGAPSTKMTLTAAIGAAVLASMWGSML